jgi:hypothetical protein
MNKINRRIVFALVSLFFLGTHVIAAPKKTYRYKCPKCQLIQEYATPGTKKCPNDGRIMIRIN